MRPFATHCLAQFGGPTCRVAVVCLGIFFYNFSCVVVDESLPNFADFGVLINCAWLILSTVVFDLSSIFNPTHTFAVGHLICA